MQRLSKSFGGVRGVDNVSFELGAGEMLALIGPNGAGKTTLLRAISKLIPTREGSFVMEGRRYNELRAHEVISLGIAHVPEGRRLFPRLSFEENLKMGAFCRLLGRTSRSGSRWCMRSSRA